MLTFLPFQCHFSPTHKEYVNIHKMELYSSLNRTHVPVKLEQAFLSSASTTINTPSSGYYMHQPNYYLGPRTRRMTKRLFSTLDMCRRNIKMILFNEIPNLSSSAKSSSCERFKSKRKSNTCVNYGRKQKTQGKAIYWKIQC